MAVQVAQDEPVSVRVLLLIEDMIVEAKSQGEREVFLIPLVASDFEGVLPDHRLSPLEFPVLRGLAREIYECLLAKNVHSRAVYHDGTWFLSLCP